MIRLEIKTETQHQKGNSQDKIKLSESHKNMLEKRENIIYMQAHTNTDTRCGHTDTHIRGMRFE